MEKCKTSGCPNAAIVHDLFCQKCVRDQEADIAAMNKTGSAFRMQIGGDHYTDYAIQPAEYVHKNRIPYLEGSVIYYVTRWRDKNGLADIDKAIHTLQLLKELEYGKQPAKD